jgi:serine/threonine protein kinase
MGIVFKCLHQKESFLAAIKVTQIPGDQEVMARTLREAEALSKIQHPGVVRIYSGGKTTEGDVYLAMELLAGNNLVDALPLDDPDDVMFQVAQALEVVHHAGLVHRDVKPANILLTPEGRAVLLDFGMAYDPSRTRLTTTGQVPGSPAFLAPELILGKAPSPASDWYAWGVTYYELAEGRLPHSLKALQSILTGKPPPPIQFRKLPPADPRRALLLGVLQSAPEERLQSLTEVQNVRRSGTRSSASLAPSSSEAAPREEEPLPERPPETEEKPQKKRTIRGLIALPAALLVAFLAAYSFHSTSPPPASSPPPLPPQAPQASDPWEATRRRGEVLRGMIRKLRGEHPEGNRLFCIAWIGAEVPSRIEQHVQNRFENPASPSVAQWEELLQALQYWLVQLQDWHREHPEEQDPFYSPKVLQLLQGETIPLAKHLVEDALVSANLMTLARMTPKLNHRMNEFLNVTRSFGIFLDDFSPQLSVMLPLRILLPQTRMEPLPDLAPFLPALEGAIQAPWERQEFWLAATSLLHVVNYDQVRRSLSWEQRKELVLLLDEALLQPSCMATKRERAILQGRILVEMTRLLRSADRPSSLGSLPKHFQQRIGTVRSHSTTMPNLWYSTLWNTHSVCKRSETVFYSPFPQELMACVSEEIEAPFMKLATQYRREWKSSIQLPDPQTPVLREIP